MPDRRWRKAVAGHESAQRFFLTANAHSSNNLRNHSKHTFMQLSRSHFNHSARGWFRANAALKHDGTAVAVTDESGNAKCSVQRAQARNDLGVSQRCEGCSRAAHERSRCNRYPPVFSCSPGHHVRCRHGCAAYHLCGHKTHVKCDRRNTQSTQNSQLANGRRV